MKSLLAAGFLAAVLSVGCSSTYPDAGNHWSLNSITPRVSHHFLGYNPVDDTQSYREYQYQEKQDINLTLRRHFLNHNPDNPHQPDNPERWKPRHPHSLAYPADYIHFEGLIFGAGFLGTSANAFLAIPFGSLLATLDEGGFEEFRDGFGRFSGGGAVTASFTDYEAEGGLRAEWTTLQDAATQE